MYVLSKSILTNCVVGGYPNNIYMLDTNVPRTIRVSEEILLYYLTFKTEILHKFIDCIETIL